MDCIKPDVQSVHNRQNREKLQDAEYIHIYKDHLQSIHMYYNVFSYSTVFPLLKHDHTQMYSKPFKQTDNKSLQMLVRQRVRKAGSLLDQSCVSALHPVLY